MNRALILSESDGCSIESSRITLSAEDREIGSAAMIPEADWPAPQRHHYNNVDGLFLVKNDEDLSL